MNFKKSILILCCGLAFGMTNAQQSQTFTYTGSQQSWTVPCGVTSVTIQAYGAQGGTGNGQSYSNNLGGLGGEAYGTLLTSPGSVLYIYVGGVGGNGDPNAGSPGWNGGGSGAEQSNLYGGGGGGGASDVRINGVALANRIIVGGGGGGGGTWASASGGIGAYPIGGTGGNNGCGCTPGYGGTQSAGGAGGQQGSLGTGGSGYSGDCNPGGGGGYYGGGSASNTCNTDGGGGGSSYYGGMSNGTGNSDGVQSGNGQVTITWNTAGPLTLSGNVIKNVLCNGGSTGSASGILSGGGSPYTYLWNNLETTDTATGLSAGTYTIGVSDACGNTASVSVSITQPTVLSASASVVSNVLCNGESNGNASSGASGGTSPYTYAWSNLQLTPNATGLSAGTYTIGIKDANGCTATASVSISQPTVLSVSPSAISNVSCNGESDGSASSNASGGTSPYTYAWSNLQLTANATGLSAGTYTIGVSDGNGCTASASVSITQPNALSVSAIISANVLCNGGGNGVAASGASGGTSPYTYSWSNAESNSNATGLSAGTYTITVMDNNGCTGTASAAITQPNALSASPSAISNVSCNGGSNGSLSSNASGGTSPYTYLWSNLQSSPNATGLAAGTYTLGLTDANGCTASASVGITQPVAIGIVSHSQADNGSGNGAAWVNVSGGTGPYTYLWNPGGNSTDSISKKDSGMYCCLVTDANGCTDSTCIKIKSTLGIGNITSGSGGITVYPNPNNGQFTIVIASEAKQSQDVVEIYNVLGERVYSQYLIPNSQFLINLSNQHNGVYLYRVISESGNLFGEGKIVLQK